MMAALTSYLTIAAGLLGVFILAELVARWGLGHRAYYVWSPRARLRLHPDPETFPELERVVRFEVNSDGERGDEAPRAKSGVYRLLMAGGSAVEGYLLDQPTNWPAVAQRLLNRQDALRALKARRVHVGNIGKSGVGTAELVTIFHRVLPRYGRLDAIIVFTGAGDVVQWLEAGAPPTMERTVRTSDVFGCHPEKVFGWTPRTLALVELLRASRRRVLRRVRVEARSARWIGRARAMRATAPEIRPAVPDPSPLLDHFERNLRQALEHARAHADRVVVARQPWFNAPYTEEQLRHLWHGAAGKPHKEHVTTYYAPEIVAGLMALIDKRAARVAEAVGVEQLDLMPLVDCTLKNYYDFCHFTPAGAVAVAQAVASAIIG
jgi:lysophospholipase L1-like esterase